MIKTLIVLAILAALFVVYLAVLGVVSRSGSPPGPVDGKLKPCGDRPNCVCSEYPDDASRFVEPLALSGAGNARDRLRQIIVELDGRIETQHEDYIAASFASSLFGFVDDVEIRIVAHEDLAHIRSASRVGYSDLGANRKRVERIRARYTEE